MQDDSRIPVWDPLVRGFHWLLVAGFFGAYFTRHSPGTVHEWIGYAVTMLLTIRVAWGFTGPRRARFSGFLRGPGYTLEYARRVSTGNAVRFVGHNPLGGWMVVLLIGSVAATCLTGWMYTTDRFWGIEWVEELHEFLTWLCIGLVILHLLGVFHASKQHRENLPASMIHGFKRPASGTDVD